MGREQGDSAPVKEAPPPPGSSRGVRSSRTAPRAQGTRRRSRARRRTAALLDARNFSASPTIPTTPSGSTSLAICSVSRPRPACASRDRQRSWPNAPIVVRNLARGDRLACRSPRRAESAPACCRARRARADRADLRARAARAAPSRHGRPELEGREFNPPSSTCKALAIERTERRGRWRGRDRSRPRAAACSGEVRRCEAAVGDPVLVFRPPRELGQIIALDHELHGRRAEALIIEGSSEAVMPATPSSIGRTSFTSCC